MLFSNGNTFAGIGLALATGLFSHLSFHRGKEVGYVRSALHSPTLNATIALLEANADGIELRLRTSDGERGATIVPLPFAK